jgi:beta-lactamase class A
MLHDMKKLLIEQHALPADSRNHVEEWVVGNTTGPTMLRAGLPANWRIGDKTGRGGNGATIDIAICWPPNRAPILVTVYFVDATAASEARCAAVAQAGRIVAAKFA